MPANVPALPAPPSDHTWSLPLKELSSDTAWFRIHAKSRSPLHFNTSSDFRFNSPSGEYGVLYVAQTMRGAFAETFCRTLGGGPPAITRAQLAERAVSELLCDHELSLVDLTGAGLVKLGLDGRISAGADYSLTHAWSKWWWSHPRQAHGILYRSRHDQSELCAALFSDRVLREPSVRELAASILSPSFAAELEDLLSHFEVSLL